MKEKYYAQEISQIEKELNTSLDNGLSDNEAKKRLASDGPNSLASKKSVVCLCALSINLRTL